MGSIGLFAQDSTPIEGSFGAPGEAIAAAIDRLRPRLKLLLAGRILRLVANGETSTLNQPSEIDGQRFVDRSIFNDRPATHEGVSKINARSNSNEPNVFLKPGGLTH